MSVSPPAAPTAPGLVPLPVAVVPGHGRGPVLGPGTRVVADDALARLAGTVAQRLGRVLDHVPDVVSPEQAGGGPDVSLRLVPVEDLLDGPLVDLPPEGAGEAYRLTVDASGAVVTASAAAGLLHGATTLAQLVADGTRALDPVTVHDAPRYPWRGLSVDVARHPLPAADLLRLVDLVADLRLNVLHLHLTDDQGWRLHLPSRPLLSEASGGTAVGGDPGGFLTEADWRRLVEHAAALHVAVVPEVDVPGHVNAALHAYGELTPDGRTTEAYTGIDVGFSRLHADLPGTGPFLRDVFGDVVAMTPGRHVHIGGDEVLTMDPEEYAVLVRAAADAVEAHGRTVVGWQEIARADLTPGTVLQLWDEREDPAPLVEAARRGARVLLSPGSRAYLDMKYDETTELGLSWAGYIPFRRAWDWDPATLVPGLEPDHVVGVEAAVWSETTRTLDDVTHLLLPRLAAVAEVAWSTQAGRDGDGFEGFARRVARRTGDWDRAGLRWHPAPGGQW